MAEITRWRRLLDTEGQLQEIAWDDLFIELAEAGPFLGDDHPGWSAAVFRDNRRKREKVKRVTAAVLDYDGVTTLEAAKASWAGVRGFIHTTKSHKPELASFRVILPLERPVSAFEWDALWARLHHHSGSLLDTQARDPSRFWYCPGVLEGGVFEHEVLSGEPLNPDEWLAKPDPTPARSVVRSLPPSQDAAKIEERARKYIARMPESIEHQGGHQACWAVAVVLARGFGLSFERTFALLREDFNPRCAPPWSDRELEHKAAGAVKSERLSLGYLLRDERGWERRTYEIPAPPDDDGPPETGAEFAPDEAREPGADEEAVVKDETATRRYGVVELQSLCFEVLAEVKKGKGEKGFTTGHYELNKMLNGLRRAHVTVLGASTSWGKSSWGVMLADENLKAKVPTLVISVEDSKMMYGKRIVARRANVNAMNLRDNDCSHAEKQAIANIAAAAEAEPFLLSGVGKSVEYLAKAIRELVAERNIGLVICDYLQRFRTSSFSGDRRNQVTYIAETLSDAIKESNAAGVLLSQLKRIEGREPTMDDLKESGDIENMAEHVLLGYREKSKIPGKLWDRYLLCPKNKDGPTASGRLELPFDERTASFETVRDPEEGLTQREREDRMFDEEERRYGS
jgi:DnaB helicase-like protein